MMIKKLTVLSLVLSLLITIPAFAQTNNSQQSTDNEQIDAQQSQEIEERLQARREKIAERLSENGLKRISERCTNAQEKLTTSLTRLKEVGQARASKYTEIGDKIRALTTTLSEAGVDTGELEQKITDAQSKIDGFILQFDEYETAIDDATKIDCQEYPQDFKLSVEEAKLLRIDLIEKSQSINQVIKEDIKTVLLNIKTQLESTSQDESTETTSESEVENVQQ